VARRRRSLFYFLLLHFLPSPPSSSLSLSLYLTIVYSFDL